MSDSSSGAEQLTVLVVGGPTAVLQIGGLRLLTDPTFSPAGVVETTPGRPLTKIEDPVVAFADIGPVDGILLSHDQHADNLDPAGKEIVAGAALTLTTPAAAGRLGGSTRGLSAWESVSLPRPGGGSLTVTAVPARHGPVGCEPITGDVTGFVLHGDGVPTVYVSGDNAALELVSEVAERFPRIDVALLFAGAARTSLFDGAPLTLTSANAAKAAALLGAPQLPIPDRRHNRRVVRATSATLWRRSWWCGDGAEARSSTTPRGTPPQHR